jgi:aspartyl protease family protein
MAVRATLLAACLLLAGPAQAQSVALSGLLGGKALLVVDGAPPKSVGAGETHRGVTVISTQASQAVVEIGGKRQTLLLGGAPVRLEGQDRGEGDNRIVLQAFVALGADDARRMGINLATAQPAVMGTANGAVQAWRVKLSSVRVGNVNVHEVDAVVMPAAMPYVLLGNSFLTRFQMTRTNDQLVLERRY